MFGLDNLQIGLKVLRVVGLACFCLICFVRRYNLFKKGIQKKSYRGCKVTGYPCAGPLFYWWRVMSENLGFYLYNYLYQSYFENFELRGSGGYHLYVVLNIWLILNV